MALDVDAVTLGGEWYRHTPRRAPAIPELEPPPSGRWQRGDTAAALYLADSPETAWAEWYRFLAENALTPLAGMPRDLWRFRASACVLADLSDAGRLARVGLSAPSPTRSSWPACQQVGEELAREGWRGLIAPAAARPAGRVICLFLEPGRELCVVADTRPETHLRPPAPPRGMRT